MKNLTNLLFILLIFIFLNSCDMTKFFGDDAEANIVSFSFSKQNNSFLDAAATGVIDNSNKRVYVVLPYSYFSVPVNMTPTYQLSDGAIFKNNVNLVYTSDVNLVVENGALETSWTIITTVDTSTLLGLALANPFYINEAETVLQEINDANIIIEGGNITLSVPYQSYKNFYEGNNIGFNKILFPQNSHIDNAEYFDLKYGKTPPYSISMVSENGLHNETYNINIVPLDSVSTDILSIVADVRPAYTWATSSTSSYSSAYNAWANVTQDIFKYEGVWNAYQDCNVRHSQWFSSNIQHLLSLGSPNAYIKGNLSYISSNVSTRALASAYRPAVATGHFLSPNSHDIFISPIWTNSGYQHPPLDPVAHDTGSKGFTFYFNGGFYSLLQGRWQHHGNTDAVGSAMNVPWARTKNYTSDGWYIVQSYKIEKDSASTFSDIIINESLCESFSESGDIIEIIFKPTTIQQTGMVAFFNITAENGDSDSHVLSIK